MRARMSRKEQPEKHTITIEHEGKSYSGEYWMEKGVVYVRGQGPSGTSPEIRTLTPGDPPDALARALLLEMVEGGLINPEKANDPE